MITDGNERERLLAALLERRLPDETGRFGPFGGRYVPETLMPAVARLEHGVKEILPSADFKNKLAAELASWVGRPTALTHAARLSERWGAEVWLKREDLAHTGAHKINNGIGQALLAKALGAKRVVAETGAGQHGVASAAACARVGLPCTVYMGEIDVARQAPNVFRMKLRGAEVRPVASGSRTLKDALNEAIRDWVTNVESTYYIIGTVAGMHPYPKMVRDFQSVIGREARAQMLTRYGRLPDTVVACVGGGSNAMGIFAGFLDDPGVRLVGVEAAGEGIPSGHHSATLGAGTPGVLHGSLSYLLQDADGQVMPAHSVSAGLDYPGVGPEHSQLRDTGRVTYESATDAEALDAFQAVSRLEGIIPALETAHAFAWVRRQAGRWPAEAVVLVCLSGRGDKDVAHVAALLGAPV
jgi:tryptophan synthase beta chain